MLKLTTVQGYDVMVDKPAFLSDEPKIFLVKDDKKIAITTHSLEYENDYNEFMLKGSLDNAIYPIAQEVVKTLAKETVQLSYFMKFILKDEYAKMVEDFLD